MQPRAILLTAALAIPAAGSGYVDAVRQADEALARGDPGSSLVLLDQALRADPDGPEALFMLGRAYMGLGRPVEAVPALRRAAERLQGAARQDAQSLLAVALSRSERTAEASQVLEELLAAAPGRPGVHLDLGSIDLSQGRLAAARSHFEGELETIARSGVKDAQARARPLEGLGIAAFRMGDDAAALRALEEARALHSLTDDGGYHYGLTLLRAGKNKEAAGTFRGILARQPGHRGALQNLGRAAGALGLTQERDEALARFAELYRDEEALKSRRVQVADLRQEADRLSQNHDLIGEAEALQKAVALDPNDDGLRIDYGRALQRSGERARAEEVFKDAIARDPLHADAHFRLGRLQIDNGDLEGARASLERAAQLEPLKLSYHVSLAQTYLRMQRTDEGVRELRLARRLAPEDPESAFNLGLGLAQAGILQEAAGELEFALAHNYPDPVIHSVLAQVYGALGDTQRSALHQETFRKLTQPAEPRP